MLSGTGATRPTAASTPGLAGPKQGLGTSHTGTMPATTCIHQTSGFAIGLHPRVHGVLLARLPKNKRYDDTMMAEIAVRDFRKAIDGLVYNDGVIGAIIFSWKSLIG